MSHKIKFRRERNALVIAAAVLVPISGVRSALCSVVATGANGANETSPTVGAGGAGTPETVAGTPADFNVRANGGNGGSSSGRGGDATATGGNTTVAATYTITAAAGTGGSGLDGNVGGNGGNATATAGLPGAPLVLPGLTVPNPVNIVGGTIADVDAFGGAAGNASPPYQGAALGGVGGDATAKAFAIGLTPQSGASASAYAIAGSGGSGSDDTSSGSGNSGGTATVLAAAYAANGGAVMVIANASSGSGGSSYSQLVPEPGGDGKDVSLTNAAYGDSMHGTISVNQYAAAGNAGGAGYAASGKAGNAISFLSYAAVSLETNVQASSVAVAGNGAIGGTALGVVGGNANCECNIIGGVATTASSAIAYGGMGGGAPVVSVGPTTGGKGGAATATAFTLTASAPATAISNASGGLGGLAHTFGGAGGDAASTATATSTTTATAVAYARGGDGGGGQRTFVNGVYVLGTLGNGGNANATATAVSKKGGAVNATATAYGGQSNATVGPGLFGLNGNATVSATATTGAVKAVGIPQFTADGLGITAHASLPGANLIAGLNVTAEQFAIAPITTDVSTYSTYNQSGGTLAVVSSFTIASGATYTISGGTLTAPAITNVGTFEYQGGSVSGNVDNTGAFNVRGGGTQTLAGNLTNEAGATLTTFGGTTLAVTGTLTNGGTAAVDGLQAGGLVIAGGTLQIRPQPTPGATSTVGSLSFATTGGVPTGTLDLTNNRLVIPSGGVSGAAVQSLLTSGYAGGTWTGTGITSSTAAAAIAAGQQPVLSVGWGTDANNNTVIAYTLAGDANLDGSVDSFDLTILLQNYGRSGMDWAQGDFDYDGVVGFSDLLLLAQNYGDSLNPAPQVEDDGLLISDTFAPLLAGASEVGELPAVEAILVERGVGESDQVSTAAVGVAVSVPEPRGATVLLAALAGLGARGRRRRPACTIARGAIALG